MPGDMTIMRAKLNKVQLEETVKRAREYGITEEQLNASSSLLLSEMDLAPRARRPRVNLVDGSLDYSRHSRTHITELESDYLPPIKPFDENPSKLEIEDDRSENSFYGLTARGKEYLNAPVYSGEDILGGLSDED